MPLFFLLFFFERSVHWKRVVSNLEICVNEFTYLSQLVAAFGLHKGFRDFGVNRTYDINRQHSSTVERLSTSTEIWVWSTQGSHGFLFVTWILRSFLAQANIHILIKQFASNHIIQHNCYSGFFNLILFSNSLLRSTTISSFVLFERKVAVQNAKMRLRNIHPANHLYSVEERLAV